jgi:hypothetical protein
MKTITIVSAAMFASAALVPMSNAQAMTFVSYGTALPTGETLITDFSTGANLTGGTLVTGSQGGVTAAPAYSSAPTFDTAQYLSVQGGQSATLTFGATREVSVYLGSLDAYNTLSFGGPGGATFTGADLGAVSGANNGDQTGPETDGRFVFDFSAPVTSATFTSTSNAFEVASVASIAAVPEPASWALMLMGFGTAGAALRSSRRQRVIA